MDVLESIGRDMLSVHERRILAEFGRELRREAWAATANVELARLQGICRWLSNRAAPYAYVVGYTNRLLRSRRRWRERIEP